MKQALVKVLLGSRVRNQSSLNQLNRKMQSSPRFEVVHFASCHLVVPYVGLKVSIVGPYIIVIKILLFRV